MFNHPAATLLSFYLDSFQSLKEEHQDLDNLAFYKTYGIYLDFPVSWPLVKIIDKVLSDKDGSWKKILIIYPSTPLYDQLSSGLKGKYNIKFFNWHELAVSMHRMKENVLYFNSMKEKIMDSDLIFFFGAASSFPDVVDQVRLLSQGPLVIFG